MSRNDEKYILKDVNTNLFLKGYKGNKPLWTGDEKESVAYKEMDALRMQRRLETQYSPAHKIVMVEKK